MSAHIENVSVDKENVGPTGRPFRTHAPVGLSSGGRKVLGRRDNTLPEACPSTGKHQLSKIGMKPSNQEAIPHGGSSAPRPAGSLVKPFLDFKMPPS